MPLRPVSELGLVDLTDLASQDRGEAATRRPPTRARNTRSQSARRGPNKDPRGEQTVDQSERGPAPTTGRRQAGGRSSKRLGGSASKNSGPPQSRAAATQRDAPSTRKPRTNGATGQKSSSGKRQGTRDGSKRSISKSKHWKDGSSDGIRRTASASTQKRRKHSGSGSRPEGDVLRRSASSKAEIRRGVSPGRRKGPGSQREMKRDSFKTQSALANAQPVAAKIGISVAAGAMGIGAGLLVSRAALRRYAAPAALLLPR